MVDPPLTGRFDLARQASADQHKARQRAAMRWADLVNEQLARTRIDAGPGIRIRH